jgi:hypothetical protein
MKDLDGKEDLSYQEYPIKILETSEMVTWNKKIKMCKMQWSHHTKEEAIWEREEELKAEFPSFLASYFRIWVHTWLVMLSHAVLSVVQVFPSLWYLAWLVECWECWSSICRDVRWPWWGSMLWFEKGLEWWRQLESVRWCGLSCSNLLRTES